MTFAINLALLLLGTTAALAAFGGETWKKGDEPLHRRVTRRGWLALICMLATLTLGITKEIRNNAATAAAATKQRELENSLASTTADLRATRENLDRASTDLRDTRENLARATEELGETRAKLAAVEPNILQAMLVATAGLRRESDFSTPTIRGQPVVPLLSGRTNSALFLYGGDLVDYHVFCSDAGHRIAGLPSSRRELGPLLILRVGDTDYPLGEQGRQMIIGPVGQPLKAAVLNPIGLQDCQLKILVESADRTREAAQIEPLIRMIKDAKASAANR
jgi:hypothetical protein